MEFRKLKADEIEVRVGMVKQTGCSLLLYKNARGDMNVLDETVGAENWQRSHKELKGTIYAGVGIFNGKIKEWVWKWDCGTESYAEKEKGEASDSFKRACVNWGIGRELYTAPFIWIISNNVKIDKNNKGKFEVKDKFKVVKINYINNKISELEIINKDNQKTVFTFKLPSNIPKSQPEGEEKQEIQESRRKKTMQNQFDIVMKAVEEGVMKIDQVQQEVQKFGVDKFKNLTYEQAESICKTAKKRLNK